MKERTVTFTPAHRGQKLTDLLDAQDIPFFLPCGGRGSCGHCQVKVIRGDFYERTPAGHRPLRPDPTGRISLCRAYLASPGGEILVSVPEAVPATPAVPAGTADSSAPTNLADSTNPAAPATLATLPAGVSLSDCAVALDLGTTTLAAELWHIPTGQCLAQASCLNAQGRFGADVISRIRAAKKHRKELQTLVLDNIRTLLTGLVGAIPPLAPGIPLLPTRPQGAETGDPPVKAPGATLPGAGASLGKMAVAGNPTMLHLLAGYSPEGLGRFPFTPAFTGELSLDGQALALPVTKIRLLSALGPYLGSDAAAGAVAFHLCRAPRPLLFWDGGTNGEMFLYTGGKDGRLFGTSAPAGPALEGAGISCGVGGIPGAVRKIAHPRRPAAPYLFETVGDAPPAGLCGAGLCSLISLLQKEKRLSPTGDLAEPFVLSGIHRSADGEVLGQYSCALVLTSADVQAFRTARAATRAAIELLCLRAGLSSGELSGLWVAGGLGNALAPEDLLTTGLIPPMNPSCIRYLGNAALAGAAASFTDPDFDARYEAYAARCEVLVLNEDPRFESLFLHHLSLSDPAGV